jgi:lipid A ethanolaminephosphotransferase
MGLRLFHITEYAQSVFLSPESQREATPAWVVLLASGLWLALVGNGALWLALFKLPAFSTATPWGLIVTLALMVMCAISMLLCVLNWHFTLKPAITLALLLAAFNTHGLLTQNGFLDSHLIQRMANEPQEVLLRLRSWGLFFTLIVIGAAPALWLWRTSIRRVTLVPNLMQNIIFILLLGLVLLGLWLVDGNALSALVQSQPELAELVTPINTFRSLTNTLRP